LDFEHMTRDHRELFENVRNRTGMYFQQETYAVVAAFLLGYDSACEGGLLAGFREWLVVRLGTGSNLAWSALVLHAAFPNAPSPQQEVLNGPSTERRAIETLFDLLTEFEEVRSQPDGLRKIFGAFDVWSKGASSIGV
jgi:hypothetical protein